MQFTAGAKNISSLARFERATLPSGGACDSTTPKAQKWYEIKDRNCVFKGLDYRRTAVLLPRALRNAQTCTAPGHLQRQKVSAAGQSAIQVWQVRASRSSQQDSPETLVISLPATCRCPSTPPTALDAIPTSSATSRSAAWSTSRARGSIRAVGSATAPSLRPSRAERPGRSRGTPRHPPPPLPKPPH